MKQIAALAVKEDPDQLFFGFYDKPQATNQPAAPRAAFEISATGAVSTSLKSVILPHVEATAAVAAESTRAGVTGFMTEARAAELFLDAARELRAGKVLDARVIFKPFRATLYSFKIGKGGVAQVKFHVAFRRAAESVIRQAAEIMLCRRARQQPARRAEYDAFVRVIPAGDFELPGARKGRQVSIKGPGEHRSLDESFDRVNVKYFESRLEKPELCWSPIRARRILGSYNERKDRLIISQLFDTPKMPLFVLDYLMYHELLHKFLGTGKRNDGKRCLHGKDFRELEQRFEQFEAAQKFLKRL